MVHSVYLCLVDVLVKVQLHTFCQYISLSVSCNRIACSGPYSAIVSKYLAISPSPTYFCDYNALRIAEIPLVDAFHVFPQCLLHRRYICRFGAKFTIIRVSFSFEGLGSIVKVCISRLKELRSPVEFLWKQ